MWLGFLFCTASLDIKFDFTTATFLSSAKIPELRISYEIPQNQLTFIKLNDKFTARYQVTCILSQKDREIGDTWILEDTVGSYEATSRRDLIKGTVRVGVPAGNYKFKFDIDDLNSQRAGEVVQDITVKDLTQNYPQSVSDFLFTSKIYEEGDTGALYFEVYNFSGEPFELTYKIGEIEGHIQFTDTVFVNPVKIEIPVTDLEFGTQLVRISMSNLEFQDTLYIKEPFWARGYEERVTQLYYIAEPGEIDSLRDVPITERELAWKKFWKKRDPTPGTEKNEFEEVYFQRIDYANEHFSCSFKGWKTDRGRVYIKIGAPDDVERHPFEIDQRPYEVWYYYALKFKFVFVDEHGFGDYVLVSPPYWDEDIQFR